MARPSLGERDFIDAIRALATDPAARGLADDAAVLDLGDETLVLTHDAMVEGFHWLPGQDPADVAWKLVAVNLSDLAAKGAEPLGLLLGYSLSESNWDRRFIEGLREALKHFGTSLLGGDTVFGGGARTLGLTALGRAAHRPVPARSGAQPGDIVYLTGSIGAAMVGFEALRESAEADSHAFRRPEALLAQGQALAPHVSAMMDVSDGLLLDAWRMASASGATLAIDKSAVPLAAPEQRRDEALRWGDDYQLLFTAPKSIALPVNAYAIGKVEHQGEAPLRLDGTWLRSPNRLGYLHDKGGRT